MYIPALLIASSKTCELSDALGHSGVRGPARYRLAPALHLDLSGRANVKPHTENSWTATYYKNDLDKEKRWLKIKICVRFDIIHSFPKFILCETNHTQEF